VNIPWDHETCLAMCKGETGPVCAFCSKPIDITKGNDSSRPHIKDHYSFHIPRFVLPSRLDPRKWNDLKSSITGYFL